MSIRVASISTPLGIGIVGLPIGDRILVVAEREDRHRGVRRHHGDDLIEMAGARGREDALAHEATGAGRRDRSVTMAGTLALGAGAASGLVGRHRAGDRRIIGILLKAPPAAQRSHGSCVSHPGLSRAPWRRRRWAAAAPEKNSDDAAITGTVPADKGAGRAGAERERAAIVTDLSRLPAPVRPHARAHASRPRAPRISIRSSP